MSKVSTNEANIANRIADHVADRFPNLARNPIHNVWFTGSSVWSMLYKLPRLASTDWDIFTIGESAAMQLVTGMSWNLLPSFPTRDKRFEKRDPLVNALHIPKLSKKLAPDGSAYSDGYCYITSDGDVDVWVSSDGDPIAELRTYPTKSHAHCRAAFSFTDGLIVLPNDMALT